MNAPQINIDPKTAAIVTGIVVGGVILLAKLPTLKEVVTGTTDMVGGVLSGNNAITEGARTDAYTGAGALGTLGAAADTISGGTLSRAGEAIGGWLYDIFGNDYDPNAPTTASGRGGASGSW